MEDIFRSYWWLLFPLAFFVFGAWDRWLSYRRSQDRLELIRSFTSQGKDVPPELLRTLGGDEPPEPPPGDYSGRYARRYYRRYWRHGPYWAWRSAFVTGAVAMGFWFASVYVDAPGVDWPFRLVAIILTCVSAGHLMAAIFSTTFRDR